MNSIIRILSYVLIATLLTGCIIQNPSFEECDIVEIDVTEISEGSSYDIVIKDESTDYFYVNRGLERGLSIDSLKQLILNKKVTLHLPKFGFIQSEHIAQLVVNGEVIYSEFKVPSIK